MRDSKRTKQVPKKLASWVCVPNIDSLQLSFFPSNGCFVLGAPLLLRLSPESNIGVQLPPKIRRIRCPKRPCASSRRPFPFSSAASKRAVIFLVWTFSALANGLSSSNDRWHAFFLAQTGDRREAQAPQGQQRNSTASPSLPEGICKASPHSAPFRPLFLTHHDDIVIGGNIEGDLQEHAHDHLHHLTFRRCGKTARPARTCLLETWSRASLVSQAVENKPPTKKPSLAFQRRTRTNTPFCLQ